MGSRAANQRPNLKVPACLGDRQAAQKRGSSEVGAGFASPTEAEHVAGGTRVAS